MRTAKSLIITLILLLAAGSCWAGPSVQAVGKDAKIDWTNNVYIATGEGVVPTAKDEPNRGRAYLKAKGYAKMAAIANLLMAIKGTAISYNASGKDFMADEQISQKIEGFVNNVQITSERKEQFEGQTLVIVEVRAPMYGQEAPGSVFMQAAVEKSCEPAVSTAPAVPVIPEDVKVKVKANVPTEVQTAQPSAPAKPYTSLVVDTTGLNLNRCMSPKIRKQSGEEVWGTVKADYDYLQDHGIVAYTTSLVEAKKCNRCGDNPLIIHAIGRAGGKFYSDPVISDADATLLLEENKKSGFLDKFNVVFIKDGNS